MCAGQVLDVAVTGANGVPSAGVDSVVLNVTAISPSQASFLTVFPRGAARPNTSNLNFTAQTTIPNLVIAKVGDSGQVSIYNNSGCVDVAADIAGWFTDTGSTPPSPEPPAPAPLPPMPLMPPPPPPPPLPGVVAGSGAAYEPASNEATPSAVLLNPGMRCFSPIDAYNHDVAVTPAVVTGRTVAMIPDYYLWGAYGWTHESYGTWWLGYNGTTGGFEGWDTHGGFVAVFVWVWDYAAQSYADSAWAVNIDWAAGGWWNSYYYCYASGSLGIFD